MFFAEAGIMRSKSRHERPAVSPSVFSAADVLPETGLFRKAEGRSVENFVSARSLRGEGMKRGGTRRRGGKIMVLFL